MTVWSSILSFYLTSYCDFLFQVKHSFLLLDQSGEFRRLEPRYHLRESQDLLVHEWEEMAGEFTHQVSHSIITPFLCFCALRLNTKACFLCTDLICFHDMKVTPTPPFPLPHCRRCENRARSGPSSQLVGTAAQMIWARCRFHDSFSESTPWTWASTSIQQWFTPDL